MYRCPPVGEGAVAVLNGCETAVRDLRAADEAMGLMSAFLLRGASLVLATQWRVLDACAAEMAIKFVTEWASGARPADALRSAQRLLRQMTTEEILARYDQALRLFPSADCPHESAALHREAALLSRLSGRNAEAKAHAVHAAQAFRRTGVARRPIGWWLQRGTSRRLRGASFLRGTTTPSSGVRSSL